MCFTWRSNNETAWCAEGPEFDSGQNLFFFFLLSFFFVFLYVQSSFQFSQFSFISLYGLCFFQIYKFSSILLYFPFNFLSLSRVLREILRFTYFQLKGLFHSVYRVFSKKFVFYCRFVAARQLWVICNRDKFCVVTQPQQTFASLPAYCNFESTKSILAMPK